MPSRIDPAAATNAFARQVQLGANMRASDQAEEMNALSLQRMRREEAEAAQPKYDAQAFPRVGQIAAQVSSIADPAQKRAAFKQAILGNGAAFDALGMPHADALVKIDSLDDAGLDATLQKLASFAPQAAPTEVSAGNSLVRPDGRGGFTTAYTAPTKPEGESGFSLSPGQVRFDAQGRRIAGVAPTPEKPDGTAFDNAAKLRGEFNAQSKEFRGVADSYQRIVDSAKDPSAAGDLSLIFNYMKVLDPGSTVREGEFATAQQAGSVPARIVAQYNKLLSGERLAPEQRADFVDRATRLYKGQEARFNSGVRDRYEGLARRYGLDPAEVLSGVAATIPAETPPPRAAAPGQPIRVSSPAEAMSLPPGTVFITPDGRQKVRP